MRRRLRDLAAPGLIVLGAAIAYWNSREVPLHLDDLSVIRENPSIRQLWPIWPALSPPDHIGTGGRPLSNLSFAFNYAVSGEAVWSYHLLNVALHACAGLVLFGVLRRTLNRIAANAPASPVRVQPNAREGVALAIAAIWVVHPLQTATVTYISQRTELLMGLCYLTALYSFLRAKESVGRKWTLACVAACFAGMACKESMVTAPVVILLYDRTFLSASFAQALRARAGLYAALASSWLLLALFLTSNLHERHLGFNLGVSPWVYALTECQAIVAYLRLSVWPHPLVFDYGAVFLRPLTTALPYAAVVALALGLALRLFQRGLPLSFPALAFFAILAPTSSFIPVALQPIAENRMYLPLAAVVTILILGLHAVAGSKRSLFTAVIAIALIACTIGRNSVFQSALRLWGDTIQKRPQNARAFDNYAQALAAAGRPAEAVPHLQRALAINPLSAATHAILGDTFLNLRHLPEAERSYRAALAIDGEMVGVRNNLGAILIDTGRLREAVTVLLRVVSQTESAPAHHNLGLAFSRLLEADSAERHFRKALHLAPTNPQFHYNLAHHLSAQRHWARASEHYREAIKLSPHFALAHAGLAISLLELEDYSGALQHCEISLSLDPVAAETHNNAGVALFRLGRLTESAAHFAEAVRLKPDYEEARRNLTNVTSVLPR